jgi:arginine repressor
MILARKKAHTAVANKSDTIREILKAQPNANQKEVKAALQERGVKASDALISKIKYGRKSGAAKKTRGRRAGKSRVTKADAIRKMLDKLGADARPRDVIAALALRGVKVTSAQVSTLQKGLSRRRASTAVTADSVSFAHLLAARDLAERLGGIDVARQALASLARLLKAE